MRIVSITDVPQNNGKRLFLDAESRARPVDAPAGTVLRRADGATWISRVVDAGDVEVGDVHPFGAYLRIDDNLSVVDEQPILECALLACDDEAGPAVLGDLILETGWRSPLVRSLVGRKRNRNGVSVGARRPTKEWARAVAAVLLTRTWGTRPWVTANGPSPRERVGRIGARLALARDGFANALIESSIRLVRTLDRQTGDELRQTARIYGVPVDQVIVDDPLQDERSSSVELDGVEEITQ